MRLTPPELQQLILLKYTLHQARLLQVYITQQKHLHIVATSAVETTPSNDDATVATINDANLVSEVFSATKLIGGKNHCNQIRKQEPQETTQLNYRGHTPYLLSPLQILARTQNTHSQIGSSQLTNQTQTKRDDKTKLTHGCMHKL